MLTRHTRAFLLKVQNNFILQNLLQMVITTWSSHLQLGRLLAKLFFDGWVLSIFDDQTTHSVAANKGEGNSRCLLWILWKIIVKCRWHPHCCDAAVSRLCSPPLFVFTLGYSRNNSASRCQLCSLHTQELFQTLQNDLSRSSVYITFYVDI